MIIEVITATLERFSGTCVKTSKPETRIDVRSLLDDEDPWESSACLTERHRKPIIDIMTVKVK